MIDTGSRIVSKMRVRTDQTSTPGVPKSPELMGPEPEPLSPLRTKQVIMGIETPAPACLRSPGSDWIYWLGLTFWGYLDLFLVPLLKAASWRMLSFFRIHTIDPIQPYNSHADPGKVCDLAETEPERLEEVLNPWCMLQKARIEYPPKSYTFFVPKLDRDTIITEQVVMDTILAKGFSMSTEKAHKYATEVYKKAKNLFAILVHMGKGAEVCAFLDANISDEDLPFERSEYADGECDFSLQLKNGIKVEVMKAWEPIERELFGKTQWLMLAPEFEDKEHHELHDNTVLPFVTGSGQAPAGKDAPTWGGYSTVFFARIHSSHYKSFHGCHGSTTKDNHTDVAIKKLMTTNRQEFENERDILRKLGSKQDQHPHLVQLLTSYEIKGEFYLVFPRASCNLRHYWEKHHPKPTFDFDTVFWSLKQIMGIAQGLNAVHNFKVTTKLDHRGNDRAPQRDVQLSVAPGEGKYGRHGDIKPENIIFFKHASGSTDDLQGILQITDFGLGRFHGRDSRTEKWPHGVVGSPTYEPPECKLHRPVSRAYDLWSLGCLYLEFATWLLKGGGDITSFSESRVGESAESPAITDDLFFTIIKDEKNHPLDAEVRDGVRVWVRKLHQHPKCSDLIHQLLDLVMEDLLCINATDRIETSVLCERFRGFQEKAMRNRNYICVGRPHPATPRASSEPTIDPTGHFQKSPEPLKLSKRVTFTKEPEEYLPQFGAHRPSSAKSLVPRRIFKKPPTKAATSP